MQLQIAQQTIECARAIGLDDEYLKKIEEQNRLREEIMRKKNQHRKKTYEDTNNKDEQKTENNQTIGRTKTDGIILKQDKTEKLRPYLAVVVTNLRGVANVDKKLAALASSVGTVKVQHVNIQYQ